jgi:iron(III) transport system ATP-binding protein
MERCAVVGIGQTKHAKVREDLRAEIKDLQTALSITTIMVTHDQHEAMEMADRIVVMNRGVIEQIGAAADLYDRPVNRFVAESSAYESRAAVGSQSRRRA